MSDNKLPDKLYYRIGEVAEYLRVEPSTLRFWENEFKEIKPKRHKNERLYRKEDIETFEIIRYLLKEERFTIEGARQKLKWKRKEYRNKMKMIQRLENFKQDLIKLREKLTD